MFKKRVLQKKEEEITVIRPALNDPLALLKAAERNLTSHVYFNTQTAKYHYKPMNKGPAYETLNAVMDKLVEVQHLIRKAQREVEAAK